MQLDALLKSYLVAWREGKRLFLFAALRLVSDVNAVRIHSESQSHLFTLNDKFLKLCIRVGQ